MKANYTAVSKNGSISARTAALVASCSGVTIYVVVFVGKTDCHGFRSLIDRRKHCLDRIFHSAG